MLILSQGYQQLLLDKELSELITVNTHLGLYHYSQLPFGVASAPAIFQRTMDQLINGLRGVRCYMDDSNITGKSTEEHLNHLSRVLEQLQDKGFRLKKDKCHFLQSSVEYLGHVIDTNGLHTTPTKQQAITEARAPTNTSELCSFLGLVNYYGRFLPNVSTTLHPLNHLLWKGAAWVWSKKYGKKHFRPSKTCWVRTSCSSLWPDLTLESRSWCLCILCRGSDFPKIGKWWRASHCLCLSDTNACITEVRTNGEGGIGTRFCGE